jgi:hypothetical protein
MTRSSDPSPPRLPSPQVVVVVVARTHRQVQDLVVGSATNPERCKSTLRR